MASSLQRVSGSGEDVASDPGLYIQLSDAGTRLLAGPAFGNRMCGQICWRKHRQVP